MSSKLEIPSNHSQPWTRHRRCVQCGDDVLGKLEGIRLSICCLRCCRKYFSDPEGRYAGRHRVSRKQAWNLFGITKKESFRAICGLEYTGGGSVTLYLGAEAQQLGKLERSKKAITSEEIRNDIQNCFGISVKDHDSALMAAVFGKYVEWRHRDDISCESPTARLGVLDQAESIRVNSRECHPDSILDFVLANKEATVENFLAFRNTVRSVFKEEGHRIMKYLTPAEQQGLIGTPLEEEVESFRRRNKRDSIYSLLRDSTGEDTATMILNHPACQSRIWREENEVEIAKKLLSFWETKDDVSLRTHLLKSAYRRIGKQYDYDVSVIEPCLMFIDGKIDCDPEEIVGVCVICSTEYGRAKYRRPRQLVALTAFEEIWHSKKVDVEGCIQEAIDQSMRALAVILGKPSSWDYRELTKGFWNQYRLL